MFDEPKRMTMMDDRLLRLGDSLHAAPPPRTPAPSVPAGFDAATLKVVCAPSPAHEPALAGDVRP